MSCDDGPALCQPAKHSRAGTGPNVPEVEFLMWSRSGRLLIGAVLLATGAYFIFSASAGWKPLWERQVAARPASPDTPAPEDPDSPIAAAKLQAYGPLASVANDPALRGDTGEASSSTARTLNHAHTAMDRVVSAPADAPKHFLHQRFALSTYQGFEFIVPAHATYPRLHGTFKSLANGRSSGRTANVDILLLNPREFSDFLNGDTGTATFTNASAAGGEIDLALNSPMYQPQHYYLIFRNAPGSSHTKLVTADFVISFE